MTWEYSYDEDSDETRIYWEEEEKTTIDGKITRWRNGYPASEEAREAIRDVLQTTDHPTTVLMDYDMNFGFEERESDQS